MLGIGLSISAVAAHHRVGGHVYLSDYATAGDGADQHDAIMLAYGTGKEVRIRAGEWYRTTQTLTLPAGSRTRCEDPQTGGYILDMPASDGIVLGDGSAVMGLGAKSLDYPSAAIAFDTNYILGRRCIKTGNNCTLSDVYISDLAGGIDCINKSGLTLSNINGSKLRSRSGWTALIHSSAGSNIVAHGIYGTDCDRYIEIESGSHDCSFDVGTATNIYPNGYTGQPGAEAGTEIYATAYSRITDIHAHVGEYGCYNVHYSNISITNSLGAISAERSNGSNYADLSHDCSWSNITINSPRGYNPVDLQGYNLSVTGLTFGGTRNGALSRLIYTRAAVGSDAIVVNGVTIPDNWYGQPVAQFLGAGSHLLNANIGTRSTATVNPFYVYRVEANNCSLEYNYTKQPTYSAAVYYFASGTTGNSRVGNTYTLSAANAPAAAVVYNGTTVTESGNADGV